MIANALPDGLTTRERHYVFLPAYGGALEDGTPADGTLAVSETTGVDVVRYVARRYAIQEEPPVGYPGRVLLLVKLAERGRGDTAAGRQGQRRAGEVYRCRVPSSPSGRPHCTCAAGATAHARNPGGRVQSVPCVHLEVLTDLIAAGLESPFAATEPPAAPTPIRTPAEDADLLSALRLEEAREAYRRTLDEVEAERGVYEPCPF